MSAIDNARTALAYRSDDPAEVQALTDAALRGLIAEHERLVATAEGHGGWNEWIAEHVRVSEELERLTAPPTDDAPTVMVAEPFTGSSGVSLVYVSPYADGVPALMVDGVILPPNSVKALREFFQPAQPTDDDREALAAQYAWAHGDSQTRVDFLAGYDAGFRRQGPIPTVEEYKATMVAVRARQVAKGYDAAHDDEHGIRHILNWAIDYARRHRSDDSAGMIVAALELLDRQGPITDAQVECPHWEPGRITLRNGCTACAALEAARDAS